MQTIHSLQARRTAGTSRGASLGAALSTALGTALVLGTSASAWAQQPPAQPAPVPLRDEAAAAATVSGSGATTGAGSDPISATTMMRATDTPASSNPTTAKQSARSRRRRLAEGAIEPWQGRRVLLLQPLRLGPGFNADRAFGTAILSRAEAVLQEQLESTGKFSVIRAHRFSPLIQRALQEKRLTEAQAEEAIKTPSPTGSSTVFLQQFTFDQVPLIGEFSLEEVRSGTAGNRPSVQAQVSGRLYELNNPVPLKAPVLTSNAVTRGRNNIERYLGAVRDGFGAIAAEMTAPLEDVELPSASASTDSPGAATGGAGAGGAGTGDAAATDATVGSATPSATVPEPIAPEAPATAPGTAPATAPGTAPATAPGTAPGTQ